MVLVKDINRQATFTWLSDATPRLAIGSYATRGQGSHGSNNASNDNSLEIWDVTGVETEAIASVNVDSTFRDIDASYGGNLIAAAMEDQTVRLWNYSADSSSDSVSLRQSEQSTKHTGAINSVAFNPVQKQMVATAGSNGEVFIWDCNKFEKPYETARQSSRHDDFLSVGWNNNLASHILAISGESGFTSIYDLKNGKEVVRFQSIPSRKSATTAVAWHPTISTKLAVALGDDSNPAIAIWDMRNQSVPERVLQSHTEGILSLDWCSWDSSLLLSCGKDNRTLLWNPEADQSDSTTNGGLNAEYPIAVDWTFKTRFSPRVPDLFATASLDGKVTVQTLQDVEDTNSSQAQAAAVSGGKNAAGVLGQFDSESGADFWDPSSYSGAVHAKIHVKQAPQWLKRPVSASFGFGGKLVKVSLADNKSSKKNSIITISKFVEDETLTDDTSRLAKVLSSDTELNKFLEERVNEGGLENVDELFDWEILKETAANKSVFGNRDGTIAKRLLGQDREQEEEEEPEAEVTEQTEDKEQDFEALINGKSDVSSPFSYSSQSDFDQTLTDLIGNGKFKRAVNVCIKQDRLEDALALSLMADQEAQKKAKEAYISCYASKKPYVRLYKAISSANLTDIVNNSDISEWRQTMQTLFSHAKSEQEFSKLSVKLGDRILEETKSNRNEALLCYIAGSSTTHAAKVWLDEVKSNQDMDGSSNKTAAAAYDAHVKALHHFMEKATVLSRVIHKPRNTKDTDVESPASTKVYEAFREYINIIASQGHVDIANKFFDLLPSQYAGASLDRQRMSSSKTSSVATTASKAPVSAQPRYAPAAGVGANPFATTPSTTIGGTSVVPATGLRPSGGSPYAATTTSAAASSPYAPSAPPAVPNTVNAAAGSGVGTAAGASPYRANSPYAPVNNPYQPAQAPRPARPTAADVGPPPAASAHGAASPGGAAALSPSGSRQSGGWNDLPSSAISAPRRPPSAAQTIVSPFPGQSTAIQPPLSRQGSMANLQAPPPPGAGPTSGSRSPVAPFSPSAQFANPNVNGYMGVAGGQFGQGAPAAAAPVNPYAPSPVQQQQQQQPIGSPSMGSPNIHNPYAPPPGQQLQQGGPKVSPYAPMAPMSPQQNMRGPNVPPSGLAGPPQSLAARSVAAHEEAQAQRVASVSPIVEERKPAAPPRHPAGDRSHIPSEARPIYEILSSEMERVKPEILPNYGRQVADAEKRLNILYDHLNNEELLTPDTVNDLVELSECIARKDYTTAMQLHIEILTTRSEQCGQWMTGIKRLIEMGRAIP